MNLAIVLCSFIERLCTARSTQKAQNRKKSIKDNADVVQNYLTNANYRSTL